MQLVDFTPKDDADNEVLAKTAADCLRHFLSMAENGEIVSASIVVEQNNKEAMYGFSIAAPTMQTVGACEALKLDLLEAMGSQNE